MSVCGYNATALKDLPLLTSKDLQEASSPGGDASSLSSSSSYAQQQQRHGAPPRHYVHVRFVGTAYPHKAQFKIAWSELTHLPRNADGTLRASRRTAAAADDDGSSSCSFPCPSDERLCLPDRLVCNGVVNCPSTGGDDDDESPGLCDERRKKLAAAATAAVSYGYWPWSPPSAVTLFAAVSAAVIVFGAALFVANAYCRRRRPSAPGCRHAVKSSDRIYSTVIINYFICVLVRARTIRLPRSKVR